MSTKPPSVFPTPREPETKHSTPVLGAVADAPATGSAPGSGRKRAFFIGLLLAFPVGGIFGIFSSLKFCDWAFSVEEDSFRGLVVMVWFMLFLLPFQWFPILLEGVRWLRKFKARRAAK